MGDAPRYYSEYDFRMNHIYNLDLLIKKIESISYLHHKIEYDCNKEPILLTLKLLAKNLEMEFVLLQIIEEYTSGYIDKRHSTN